MGELIGKTQTIMFASTLVDQLKIGGRKARLLYQLTRGIGGHRLSYGNGRHTRSYRSLETYD
jgi:hypothetical protein